MATPILKIISSYCSKYVDDIRLNELANTDAPLYAWNMYCYFLPAISLFTIPSEMPVYLFGTQSEPKFTESVFADTNYIAAEEYTSDLVITLGTEYAGFDLCAVRIKQIDEFKRVTYMPLKFDYNSASGTVIIKATQADPIPKGAVIDIDFYKDGEFACDLTPQMMSILGMCFQVVWQDRFNTDWLSIVPKVEDKSFFEQNRANKMNADTARLEQLRRKLAGEMRRFEQNLAYNKNILSGVLLSPLSNPTSCADYTGSYEVTPKTSEQSLQTKDKHLTENVTIESIPFFDVGNPSGGSTVYIGSEV